jgi:hypothetical protein
MILLTIDLFVFTGDETSRMITRKGITQTSGTHVLASIPKSYNISDINIHEIMEHYRCYTKILDMFENERFSSDDLDIDAYRNIRKRGIHTVVARPKLFPYNDATKWCFVYLHKYARLILNTTGLPIASLKVEDI